MSVLTGNDPFADLDVPAPLQESLQRHRKNLVTLVANLQSAGVQEAQIEISVSIIVDSYKQELLNAIKLMMR